MRRIASWSLMMIVLAAAALHAWAQQPSGEAGAAGAGPAEAKPRYVFPPPPGFEMLAVGSHRVAAAPEDVPWVRQALAQITPATRPTTMPTDLLKRLADNREALAKQIVQDLALPRDDAVIKFLDGQLKQTLQKLESIQVPVIYLVLTRDKLRELAKNGWGEPRFRYNRAADAASYDENVMISIDREMDDSPLPAFYDPKDSPEARAEKLARGIANFDAQLVGLVSQQSQTGVYNLFAQHLGETHFDPLKLPRDQEWLTKGIASYLAAKYAAILTNIPREQWVRGLTFENPQNMIRSGPIDLTHPLPESAMKPMALPLYDQAMRRKATAAIAELVKSGGGDAAISKALIALVQTKPADGEALLKAVAQSTGVDLSQEVRPQ